MQSRLFSTPEKQLPLVALLLGAATLLLYSPVTHFRFINYDDNLYVRENSHVLSGLRWSNFQWAFTSLHASNWHPLTWLSHMLDSQLFGANPAGPHYVNVLLHALNAVLLLVILYRATGHLWRSAMVAALFAVHPLNVGSVAWVAERKNMLSTLFWLLTIVAYGWYAGRPSWRRYLVVAGGFALGLMAKPMVITLPLVLLLLDYWPLDRKSSTGSVFERWWKLVAEKIPLFLMSLGSAIITVVAQRSGGSMHSTVTVSAPVRLENAVVSYAAYLWKMVWPTGLTIFYPHPMSSLAAWKVLVSAAVLIAITAIAVRWRRQHAYLLAGWIGYLVMLMPVIGLVQVGDQAMADRYAYLPLIGIFVAVVWGFSEFGLRVHLPAYSLAVAGVAVLAALSLDTTRQLPYWHDSVSLFSRALEVTDNNYVAEGNLSEALGDLGENDAALPHIRKLLALRPEDPLGYYGLALNMQRRGDCAAAAPPYRRAVDLGKGQQTAERTSFLARAYNNLGVCLRKLGQVEEAKASFADSIRSDPAGFRAYLNLGDILEDEGRHDEAIALFSKSVEITPTDGGYFLMAKAMAKENRLREAAEADRQALRFAPDNQLIQSHLASLEAQMK